MRKSIFTIERRKDFFSSFTDFLDDIQKSMLVTSTGNNMRVYEYLDHCIRYWPYRYGAISVANYLKDIDIDWSKNPDKEEGFRDALLMLELYINLLHWAPKQDRQDRKNNDFSFAYGKTSVETESARLITNAEYVLEQCCNMRVREYEKKGMDFPEYRITKRDNRVDAAIESAPELADIMLGYLDVQNANDRKYKESALDALYGYMEPKRNDYKGISCSTISEEFFASMNKLNIRHNTKSQIRIPNNKKNEIYDKLFKMAIYVLQAVDVEEYKKEMKALRESRDKTEQNKQMKTETVNDKQGLS